jgi:peptide/nickel transport system ATP-binding protein
MGSIMVPEEGLRASKLTAIPGVPPNLKNPPPGCRFAPRCKFAMPACTVGPIPMVDGGDGRAYRCILSKEILSEAHAREVYRHEQ